MLLPIVSVLCRPEIYMELNVSNVLMDALLLTAGLASTSQGRAKVMAVDTGHVFMARPAASVLSNR